MKVKPSLPLPEQYVEIGLWRQVMQMNQKVCHKMEELEKVEGSFPDDTEVRFAQNLRFQINHGPAAQNDSFICFLGGVGG